MAPSGEVATDSDMPTMLLGSRLAFFLVLLLLSVGCRKANNGALYVANTGRTGSPSHFEPRAPDSVVVKPSPVILKLSSENPVVAAGEEIRLRFEITNEGERAIQIDNDCLVASVVLRDANDAEIPGWPFQDDLLAPSGREALWTLPGGESQTIEVVYGFRYGKWSGFGVPDILYEGYAIEVQYRASSAIHAIGKLPAQVSIVLHWFADAETVRSRARRLDVAPGWSGEISSNPVKIRLVSAPADAGR